MNAIFIMAETIAVLVLMITIMPIIVFNAETLLRYQRDVGVYRYNLLVEYSDFWISRSVRIMMTSLCSLDRFWERRCSLPGTVL